MPHGRLYTNMKPVTFDDENEAERHRSRAIGPVTPSWEEPSVSATSSSVMSALRGERAALTLAVLSPSPP
jgi:hypothetical protein